MFTYRTSRSSIRDCLEKIDDAVRIYLHVLCILLRLISIFMPSEVIDGMFSYLVVVRFDTTIHQREYSIASSLRAPSSYRTFTLTLA